MDEPMSDSLRGDLSGVPGIARGGRIPIPWSNRWRHVRQRLLPMVTFLGCLLLVLWLWERQGQQPNAVGEVEAVRVDVAVRIDGMLAPVSRSPWRLLDAVRANELIARLDDRPLEAKLETFRAELLRLRKTLDAEQLRVALDEASRRSGQLREVAQVAWQVEQHRLSALDRRALLEGDRVVLQRRNARVDFLTPLHQRGAVSDVEISDERLLRDEVGKRIQENQKALAEAEKLYQAAMERLRQFPAPELAEVKRLLGPVEAAIGVQESSIRELQLEREWLEIRAPITGTIVAIHRQPGQSVRAGDPVMTIAAEQGRYIVSYVPQENRLQPEVGMAVEVRSRLPGSRPHEGVVERVGPQVEVIPQHQRRSTQVLEWGQPVRILLPAGLDARPGELVDILFRPVTPGGAG